MDEETQFALDSRSVADLACLVVARAGQASLNSELKAAFDCFFAYAKTKKEVAQQAGRLSNVLRSDEVQVAADEATARNLAEAERDALERELSQVAERRSSAVPRI